MAEEQKCYEIIDAQLTYLREAMREALGLPADAPDEDIVDMAFYDREMTKEYRREWGTIEKLTALAANCADRTWMARSSIEWALTTLVRVYEPERSFCEECGRPVVRCPHMKTRIDWLHRIGDLAWEMGGGLTEKHPHVGAIHDYLDRVIASLLQDAAARTEAGPVSDEAEADVIRWLRGAGYDDAANALAELHCNGRALRGLKPLVYVVPAQGHGATTGEDCAVDPQAEASSEGTTRASSSAINSCAPEEETR